MKVSRLIACAAFLLMFFLILFFTFRGSPNVSTLSWMPQRWGIWLDDHDEFRHFIGFAFFAGVVFLLNFDSWFTRSHHRFVRKLRSTRYRTGRLGGLLVLIYVLELAQMAMPRREFDWLDIVNGWGGVLLTWSLWCTYRLMQGRQRRRAGSRRHEVVNISSVHFR